MTPKRLSVCLFLLLVGCAVDQVLSEQISAGKVEASTESTTDHTPLYDSSSFTDDTFGNSTEAEVKKTTTATFKPTPSLIDTFGNSTEAEVQENTTATVKPTPSLIDTGSLSKHVYDDFKESSVYLQFLLVILGILTNMCNIIVFTRKQMKSATSTILTFLSCSELGAAISELIMTSCTAALGHRTYTSEIFWTLFQWIRVYLTTIFQRSSFCFNILVATERFIAVRFPLKAKQILKRRNPLVFCVVTFIIVLAMHIYNPLKMKVVEIKTRRGVIHTIKHSQLYTDDPDAFDVLSLFTKIIFSYIPLFGCFLMNILMIMALWNHRKQRNLIQANQNSQQKNDKRQIQTTITILVSTFLFVVLSLPVTTSTIAQSTQPDYGLKKKEHYLFRFITLFGGLLYLLSLSMDFIVYVILGRAFRQTFISLIRSIFRCEDDSRGVRDGVTGTRSTVLSNDCTNKAGDIAMATVCTSDGTDFGNQSSASMKYEVKCPTRYIQTNGAGNQTNNGTASRKE
ncbi:FMRFamide receptor-like [Gigantopelta aegis]|uniref:FMRFamide receptor-like n=1 Tax=Gigantopelta aegis TaxID=1735272 RepID=UPI001B888D82|nr:FMRFamide receptor-like [Gigantopelta aegis]